VFHQLLEMVVLEQQIASRGHLLHTLVAVAEALTSELGVLLLEMVVLVAVEEEAKKLQIPPKENLVQQTLVAVVVAEAS
jgi:hypothetical protein